MSVKGFYISQEGHSVQILSPQDISGGKLCQPFTMARHAHASIKIAVGASAAAFTKIIVTACDNANGDNPVPIAFDIYTKETAGADKDVLSARTAVAAGGYTPSANDDIFYRIELDAAQLPATKPYVRLSLTNGVNSVIAEADVVLTGARYASDQSETVTA